MRAFGHGSTGFFGVLFQQVASHLLSGTQVNHQGYARSIDVGETTGSNGVSLLVERQDKNVTVPAPIVASVSQFWEGNDGPWSSFAIQVGNKPQNVRVLPSTASTSTWVVYEQGCPDNAPDKCKESRGGTFNPNNSLTWVPNSIFELGVGDNLGFNVNGDFAFDTVTLGWQGSGGPTVEHSVVAGIADTSFSWLGVLPLNPRPTNFSTFLNSPQVSLLQALRNQNNIPSLSWAYTAGAQYRLNKVFGSLVLGGYDKARYTVPSNSAPDLTFPFYTDIARDLLVGISSIEASNTTSSTSSTKLLEDGIFALVDSSVPHLWLPEAVCKAFESAFGLTWNEDTELYTLNSTQHSTLSKLNPSITITLSPALPPSSADKTVAITLPYSAFSLNVSWPHTQSSTYYFPLKRASDDTQYTLGRAFLQEAYLIADYERGNFSIWPCSWGPDTNTAHIIAIKSTNDTSDEPGSPGTLHNGPDESPKKGLSTGATAGIAVGVVLGAIAVGIAVFVWFRKRRSPKGTSFELAGDSLPMDALSPAPEYEPLKERPPGELDSNMQHELPVHQKFGLVEAPDGGVKYEMADTGAVSEAGSKEKKSIRDPVYEMDGGSHMPPAIFLQPPTAISPGPDSVLPDPLPTPGQIAAAEEAERKLGYGSEGDVPRKE